TVARRRRSPGPPASASGTARLHACAQRKWTVHASPACPELEPIEIFLKLRDALFHRTPSKNIMRCAPAIARQAIVMRTNDARGPGGRIAERLEQITEERIDRQRLRVVIQRGNGGVIRADDRALLLLLRAGQKQDKIRSFLR